MTERYVPALRFRALARVYDPLLAVALREQAWRQALVRQLAVRPGMRVLDLGCGTGTLALMLAASGAAVTALDGDPDVLARARRKAAERGVHGRSMSAVDVELLSSTRREEHGC